MLRTARRFQFALAGAAAAIAVGSGAASGVVHVSPVAVIMLAVAGLVAVRYPMVLLPGFMYVGIFKDESPLNSAPVDPTLMLAGLLAAVCFVRWLEGRATPPPPGFVILLGVLGGLLLLSLSWTPVGGYGVQKAEKFVTLTALAALSPFFMIRDTRDLRELTVWIALIALLAGANALLTPPSNNPSDLGRLSLGSLGGTIGVSRLLCSGALILLLGAGSRLSGRIRLGAALLGGILIAIAAAVGSRGPLISFGLATISILAIGALRQRGRALGMLAVLAISITVLTVVPLPQTSVARVTSAFVHPASSLNHDTRPAIYQVALSLIKQDPWRGLGSGGFSQYSGVISGFGLDELYPHNILLELWVELGILGVASFAVAVVWVLWGLLRSENLGAPAANEPGGAGPLVELYMGLLLLDFFATQFSGDINDNRTFWAYLGVGWLIVRRSDLSRVKASRRPDPVLKYAPLAPGQ